MRAYRSSNDWPDLLLGCDGGVTGACLWRDWGVTEVGRGRDWDVTGVWVVNGSQRLVNGSQRLVNVSQPTNAISQRLVNV